MRRHDWLWGFALFVLLLAVVVMSLFFWQQSRLDLDLTAVPITPAVVLGGEQTAVGETALTAFGRAQNRALAWQSDAVLLSASATWPIISQLDMLLEGREQWEFIFYSPSQQSGLTASVVDGEVRTGEPYPVPTLSQPLNSVGWRINSQAAVQLFLANGGNQFFQTEPYVGFFMALSTTESNGRMEWLIAAVSHQTSKSMTMRLDATTGDILDIQIGAP
jgi:hypothetical protein